MKTIYKKYPGRILAYLMVLSMALFSTNTKAQCVPNGNVCICPMIYMPVCGCDGVLYSNDCIANCQGVVYSPAIPDGSGGFLPCATTVNCTVGVTTTSTDATSSISSDGTASAILVGPATCAATFLWSNGATTATINYLSPGSYTVFTTDCQGCVDSATVTVGASAPVCMASAPYTEDFSSGSLPVGFCPGEWSISATSGNWAFTGIPGYQAASNGRAAGTYAWIDFSGTDAGVVMQMEDVDITALSSPALIFDYFSDIGTNSLAVPNIMFVEAFDGSSWNVVGTFQQFTSGWETKLVGLTGLDNAGIVTLRFRGESGGQTTDFYNDLLIDDISIVASPSSGCTDPLACNYDSAASIDDGTCYTLTVSTTSTDVLCSADSNGTSTASANASNVTYAWSNGSSTASISGVLPGTYTVTVVDTFGCTATASATIGSPSLISGSMSIGNESTVGASDGQIDFTALGGTPCVVVDSLASTIASSNGSNGTMFNMINTSGNDITITGISQGAYAATYGGTATYNIYYYPGDYVPQMGNATGWVQVATNASATIPTTGTTTAPAYGLIPMSSITIPAGATYGFYVGKTTGTISYTTAIGTAGVTAWGSNSMLTITVGHGGLFPSPTNTPRAPLIRVHYGDPGASAYTFSWSNGDTTEDITGISAGNYCVTVTDCNGCSSVVCDSVGISATYGCTDPVAVNYFSFANIDDGGCIYDCSQFSASATISEVTCNSGSDGTAIVSATGSFASPIYLWYNGSTSDSITGLSAGSYTCIVTDTAHSCTDTVLAIVSEPASININAITTAVMPGQTNGAVNITVTGGTPCYTGSPILITEYDASAPDALEIQNVSNSQVDVTGWTVTVSQSYTDINLANTIVQTLSGTMMPGETKFWTDATTNNYWGNNLFWNNGVCTSFKGWIIIKDASGTVVDAFVACWSDAEIAASTVGLAGVWVGNGFDQSSLGPLQSASRVSIGNSSSSFVVASTSLGVTNAGLVLPFASANAYTYSWTNPMSGVVLDTTQNISGLPLGPISVDVTDCDGCTDSWSGFLLVQVVPGCTDSTMFNYNPSANISDSSCIPIVYGCLDSTALNYVPTNANTDDGSCTYPCLSGISVNTESFEDPAVLLNAQGPWNNWTYDAASSTFTGTNGWRKDNLGTGSLNTGPLNGAASLDSSYYLYCETSGQYGLVANLHSSCVDMNSFISPAFVFGYNMYGATMGTLNVDVSTDNGATWINEWTLSGDQGQAWQENAIPLNSYGGQIIRVRMSYTSGTSFTGDCAIDNLRFMESPTSGCTDPLACNYDSNAAVSDGSCYNLTISTSSTDVLCANDSNGTALVSANTSPVTYAWSNGAATATISSLVPGTYSVTVIDTFGCTESGSVTIANPIGISTLFAIGNESAAGAADGQIDLTVSGGVPCATAIQVGSGTTASYMSYLWYTFYMDGHTQITYPAAELAALGMNSGDVIDELGWKIITLGSGTVMNSAQMTVDGVVVYSGNYTPVAGMNNFIFSTPVTYTGGDLVVTWCFDNAAYTSGNNLFESTLIGGTLSNYQDLATTSGCSAIVPAIARTYRPNAYIGFASASGYNFAWSNGDTIEDITGVSAGSYCVIVTDCNGCTTNACDTVLISPTLGCTDPTAMNYNNFANVDDGSCTYDCSVFAISVDSSSNVTGCSGNSDGFVDVSSGMCTIWEWLDNNSNNEDRYNMSAGSYTLVAMSCDSNCLDTLNVNITEPSLITASMAVGNESASGAYDGQIDLSVTGGTPCITNSSLASNIGSSNGSAGAMFNMINTSGADLTITGISQGAYSATYGGVGTYDIYYYPGDYVPQMSNATGWVQVAANASATIPTTGTLTAPTYGSIPMSSVTIPAGATYGFYVGKTSGGSLSYTTATGTAGVTPWGSDGLLTITVGHGGNFPSPINTPRAPLIQVQYGDPAASAYTFVWSNGDTTEDITTLTAGVYCATITDCNGCITTACDTVITAATLGCTDASASNYSSFATVDDGSCLYPGCTDTTALNYDPNANLDDGSCILPCSVSAPVCEDFSAGVVPAGACPQLGGWSISATSGDGWRFIGTPGYQAASNGSAAGTYAWIDFSSTDIGVVMQMDPVDVSGLSNTGLSFDYFSDIGTYILATANIMYVEAYDGAAWNVIATFQEFNTGWVTKYVDLSTSAVSGVVTLRFRGESSGLGSDFYNDLLVDNVCVEQQATLISGCTNATACNYDSTAQIDDGSCIASGCTDPLALNYDASAGCDDGSCFYNCANTSAYGSAIADPYAVVTVSTCNYLSEYSTISGVGAGESYTAAISGVNANPGYIVVYEGSSAGNFVAQGSAPLTWTSGAAGTYYIHWLVDSTCATATGCHVTTLTGNQGLTVFGCTDTLACNYDPNANTDDGSCLTAYGCVLPNACNYDPLATCDDNSCIIADGCTDSLALNYDANATCDDGSCTYCVYGCTDATQSNYDANATCDDGSCIPFTYGCTDPLAINYNSSATGDDGSCLFAGCIDSLATNYDPTANFNDGSCTYAILGCTDPLAPNYNSLATIDDGSCAIGPTQCNEDAPTGLFVSDIIHNRAVINWDNMNSAACFVDQYRIKYRIVGTSSWSQKTMGAPVGSCTFPSNKTDKRIGNLTAGSVYEYQMKAWYCGGGASSWSAMNTFTTLDNCPNVGNLTVTSPTTTKATFTWDDSNGSYVFARLKARVDSISNPTGSDFFSIGGAGVNYPTFTKNKNGLVPGETYRGQARTWCDPNGGAYRSPAWTSLVYWTQPTVRIEGGETIANLDVYPNPSRDRFNVTFTSEDVQDLEVRVINIVGEVVYTEDLQQFVGEYTKVIDLAAYTKGVFFLEITTNNGVVNKKLILQ